METRIRLPILTDTIEALKQEHGKQINFLEDEIDDKKNRNMRATFVFSGIPGDEKNWNETATKLNETLRDLDESLRDEEVLEIVERVKTIPRKKNM